MLECWGSPDCPPKLQYGSVLFTEITLTQRSAGTRTLGVYSNLSVREGKIRIFFRISRKDEEFLGKNVFFVIFCLLWDGNFQGFFEKILPFGWHFCFFAPPVIRKNKLSATRI